jgi:hypothetical protein
LISASFFPLRINLQESAYAIIYLSAFRQASIFLRIRERSSSVCELLLQAGIERLILVKKSIVRNESLATMFVQDIILEIIPALRYRAWLTQMQKP